MELKNVIAIRPNKTIYRDGPYTIKLMNEDYSASDVLNEALNLSIVYEVGVKVPMLHEVLKIDGKWAIVTEFIEGRTLGDLLQDNPNEVDAYMDRFVDIQMHIHTYNSERLRHLTDKMHAKISNSGLDATIRYDLHSRLAGLPKHEKLCHGDYTPGNVIITPDDEVYIIDWAHATQGNASADAARTYLRFSLAGNQAYATKYLNLFCKKSDTAKQYVQKWLAIVSASQLVKQNPDEREFLLNWVNVVEYL